MENQTQLNADAQHRAETFAALERDPHGTPAHVPGAKLDAGKVRAGLVLGDFAHALAEVAKVGTFGAQKYTDHGWLSVPNGMQRYTDAMLRHWLAEHTHASHDDQTGLLHAAHLAWNALARLELLAREAVLRDRAAVPGSERQPLSDGRILGVWPDSGMPHKLIEFARCVEAAHGIGVNGRRSEWRCMKESKK